jgi:hypothetical protein
MEGVAGSSNVATSFQLSEPMPSLDRKIIRTGSLALEVRALEDALRVIRATTASAGGYIASESHRELEHGVGSAEITCRLPAIRLDDTVSAWRKLGVEEAFAIAARDITEEYFNADIALRNQRRLETRLLDLLNRQTNRLSDLLETEKEVARVRREIDELEGRKRLWDSQVALSSMQVALHEPRPVVASAQGGPWLTLLAAFSLAADNLVVTVAEIIALAGAAIPILMTGIAVLWAVRALWRHRRRAHRASPPAIAVTPSAP